MTNFETVIRHIDQGSTYSWDLTVLVGLDITLPGSLREKILQSRSTPDEAVLLTSLYAKTLLAHWRAGIT